MRPKGSSGVGLRSQAGRQVLAWTATSGLAVALAAAASCRTAPPAPADLRAWTAETSWNACGRCHQAVYDEWKDTLHAKAWVDPVYRMSAGSPPKTECRSCHSMEPILAGEIDVSYEWRPVFRDYNHEDGVGCVACHLRADGTVAARADHPTAPCRPRRDARITTPEYCGACHNPTHDAYFEWKTSRYAKEGVSCSDCHSWKVIRTAGDGSKRIGYSHAFPGGNDPDFVRRAVHLATRLEGRTVVMTLSNLTGHKFPGEVPSRAFIVQVVARDAEGNAFPEKLVVLKRPFKSQVGIADTRLRPDEVREIRHDLPDGARRVRVTYFFQPTPLMMEKGWFVLGTWDSEVP